MDEVKKLIAQFPCFQDSSSASLDSNGETFEVYSFTLNIHSSDMPILHYMMISFYGLHPLLGDLCRACIYLKGYCTNIIMISKWNLQ